MACYLVRLDNRHYMVEISGNQIRIDGRVIETNVDFVQSGGLALLRSGNQIREVYILKQSVKTYSMMSRNKHYYVEVKEVDDL